MPETYHPYEGSPEYFHADLGVGDKVRLRAAGFILVAAVLIAGATQIGPSTPEHRTLPKQEVPSGQ